MYGTYLKPFLFRKTILAFIAYLALTCFPYAQSLSNLEPSKVLKIVDGDTLKVNYKGEEESVRLIGIDAPEGRS
jgi:micrococcal nuclease